MHNKEASSTQSPFLNLESYQKKGAEKTLEVIPQSSDFIDRESPFQSLYELEGHEEIQDPEAEAFVSMVDQLYDQEFEEAMEDFQNEALAMYEEEVVQNYQGIVEQEAAYQRLVFDRFSPLFQEVDTIMDQFIAQAEKVDQQEITEAELEAFVEQFQHLMDEENPTFEYGWWSKLKKGIGKVVSKVKKVVKTGIKYAKKLGFGWILKRIKNYFKKYFKSFLSKIYRRLPASIRRVVSVIKNKLPGAKKYYNKYKRYGSRFFGREYLQQELDISLSAFLLAPNEQEMEGIFQNFIEEETEIEAESSSVELLDEARETFVRQLSELEEGEDPGPIVENFIAALRTALKIGVKIIGRGRVERFIAKIIARLIARFTGKRKSKWIAKMLAKHGLRLLTGELNEEQELETAHRAIAATVEDTVRKVFEMSEEMMEDESIFQSQIIESFESAAAANLVDLFSEEAYEERPELRESERQKSFWKVKTKGKKRKYCRYKKYAKVIKREINPYVAQQLRTFDGESIASVLESQLGLSVQSSIPVNVHLFELMHGGKLFHISKNEKHISGLGSSNRQAWQQIHPLTSGAAAYLLGEPGLGCKGSGKCLHSNAGKSGHRYYYLEFPQHYQQRLTQTGNLATIPSSQLQIKLDFTQSKIALSLYLNEKEASQLSQKLAKQLYGFALSKIMSRLDQGLKNAFKYYGTVRVVHPTVLPGKNSGQSLKQVPQLVLNQLQEGIVRWVEKSLSTFFKEQSAIIQNSVKDKAEGISLLMQLDAPTDMEIIKQYISGKALSLPDRLFADKNIGLNITAKPGYDFN